MLVFDEEALELSRWKAGKALLISPLASQNSDVKMRTFSAIIQNAKFCKGKYLPQNFRRFRQAKSKAKPSRVYVESTLEKSYLLLNVCVCAGKMVQNFKSNLLCSANNSCILQFKLGVAL